MNRTNLPELRIALAFLGKSVVDVERKRKEIREKEKRGKRGKDRKRLGKRGEEEEEVRESELKQRKRMRVD